MSGLYHFWPGYAGMGCYFDRSLDRTTDFGTSDKESQQSINFNHFKHNPQMEYLMETDRRKKFVKVPLMKLYHCSMFNVRDRELYGKLANSMGISKFYNGS